MSRHRTSEKQSFPAFEAHKDWMNPEQVSSDTSSLLKSFLNISKLQSLHLEMTKKDIFKLSGNVKAIFDCDK